MLNIRPVSDLRNKFSEIENLVNNQNSPVFLTKNGYGSMVVMSLELYESLTHSIEAKLDEADLEAEQNSQRLNHNEVFGEIKAKIKE